MVLDFDFDYWVALYEQSPEEFERKRAKVLEEFIQSCPLEHRNMLRVTQWECDTLRQDKDPIDAAVAISGLMHQSAHRLADKLSELVKETNKIIGKE